jgi:2-(1,2-epoxy-1,2-dihydrophenyl)acetyl-CoA isomerase
MVARVLLERAGALATLTLDDPATRNALGYRMAGEVRAAFEQLAAAQEVRVVLLCGNGGHFSSGGNLNDALEMSEPRSASRFMEGFNAMIRTVFAFPKPVIGVARGAVAGGGLGLLLCSDVILLGRSASLMQAFVHVALAPDCGTSHLLAARIGSAAAKHMTFTGRKVDAEEALRIGLGDALHDDDRLLEQAQQLAATLAARAPLAMAAAKRLLQRSAIAALNDALEAEGAEQCELLQTADFREGVQAFRQKRAAAFVGR